MELIKAHNPQKQRIKESPMRKVPLQKIEKWRKRSDEKYR
jgi:hypothetical protein